MNLKEKLLLHLKEEYNCIEIHVRNMTKAINEDDFNQAYDYARAVVEDAFNMEDLMMNYKRMKIVEEAMEAIKEGHWEDALNGLIDSETAPTF